MKRLLLAALFVLQGSLAWAGCSVGALPFQLQNNTTADATQVMANFNQIVTGAQGNCAAAGSNNDITSLGALSTPLSPSQGGTNMFVAGTSTGTNAIVVAGTIPQFSLVSGTRTAFTAGNTTTAPATLNVFSTGVKNIFRRTQFGPLQTQGGEIIAGNSYVVVYDGTEYIIENETFVIAEMRDYAGSVAPPGWIFADGTQYGTSAFPQLFNVIGYNYGGGGPNFNVPDTRGRATVGLDNFGSAIGAAGRLTSSATGCGTAMTVIGAACTNANQSHTQVVAEVGVHTHGITEPNSGQGHQHTIQNGYVGTVTGSGAFGGATLLFTGTQTNFATTGITVNNNQGSATPMAIVNPNLGVVKIIRF